MKNKIFKKHKLEKVIIIDQNRKYDKLIISLLLTILIYNITYMFFVIKEINWHSILLFSLSLLIIRFFFFYYFNRKYSYLTNILLFFKTILYNITLWLIVISIFLFYQNNINPAKLSINTISNGKQDIVFIEMAHIAWKKYYDKVNSIIKNKSNKWYILYYEWVDLDVDKKTVIDKLWLLPTPETYKDISKALWNDVEVQDSLTMIKNSKKARNTDVKFSELLSNKKIDFKSSTWTFETKFLDNPIIKKDLQKEKLKEEINWRGWTIDKLVQNSDFTKVNNNSLLDKALKYFFRWIFNFSIKNNEWIDNILSIFMPEKTAFFWKEVLEKRNKKLVYNIIHQWDKKIIITYGWKHFKGVFDLLKKHNPKWRIIKKEEITIFNK